MSGIKPLALTEFYRALHARRDANGWPMSTGTLAAELGVSGGAVRRVIGGLRRRGALWARLKAKLTERELKYLENVEQCSAWNARQMAKRPRWTASKAAAMGSEAMAEVVRG